MFSLKSDFLIKPSGNGFGLRKQKEIIGAASLGICAGYIEAAKGMDYDHRSGALSIEVEIADVKLAGSLSKLLEPRCGSQKAQGWFDWSLDRIVHRCEY